MISGTTRVCGILANPVEHSLSPLMQNFYAERMGIDLVYVPFKVMEDQAGDAVRGAYALNLSGMNVTVPHKQTVMEYVKELDDDAAAIGAVNTLVRIAGGYKGYNTDAAGLLRSMSEENIQIQNAPCILIGAGGAAKAAAYVLAKEGAKVIYVLNRSLDKAENLAAVINRDAGRRVMIPMRLSDYRKLPSDSYLAVQSTSVGMHPDVDCAPIEDPDFYRMIHTGVDIIYTPAETKFMKLVAAAGGKVINGLNMLIYQGITAFELWNPGLKCPPEVVAEARKLMLDQLGGHGNES